MKISYASLSGKNAKSVDQLIEQAINSAKSMREKVQLAAVAILIHAEKHGDWTKASDLVDGLGDGVNGAALVEWFKVYGGLIVDEKEGCFSGWKGADHIRKNFESAKATAWWELKKQSPYKGFDLIATLNRVVQQATNAQAKLEEAIEQGDDELAEYLYSVIKADTDQVRLLQACIDQMNAQNFLKVA